MPIESELLAFSRSRPKWQQDLIRRICTRPNSYREDLDQVLVNLKASHALAPPQELKLLAEEHLLERSSGQRIPIVLAAISNVHNANQLAPNQRLPFALKGITLIYGQNGSGKTGYARIVKQLCRSRRDKPEPLLGNVYKSSSGHAGAEITYLVGGEQREFHWEDGNVAPSELSRISVFDAATAPLYADHQNEIEFLPWGLDVLPHLGRTCQHLSQQLQGEIDAFMGLLSVSLPEQIVGSSAEALARRLIVETPEANLPSRHEVNEAGRWSAEDEGRISEVEKELQRLSEPARAAAQCRRFKASVDGLRQRLVMVDGLLGSEAITKYTEQFARTCAAREASSVAAQRRFDQDPLGKVVGGGAWRKLYEYAVKFNVVAYPGEEFPATGDERVCLLCQQPLDQQATERMRRFKEFMQDTSQKDSETQDLLLNGLIQSVSSLTVPTVEEMDLQFLELSAAEPFFEPVKAGLNEFAAKALSLKLGVMKALNGQIAFEDLPALDRTAIDIALDYSARLEERAQTFDRAIVDPMPTNKLTMEHKELLGRRQLHGALPTMISRHENLEKYYKLNRCKSDCDTYQISRKNSDFREKYLTADFEKEIGKQITELGLNYLPIKVDSKTERGASYVGVALKKYGNARNANILSEGEFRALALACFFAEIATIPDHDGIVVDDPVSSLDHRHTRQVANRLINEARIRSQVIVFTHDISFYYELWFAASEAGIPVHRNWVHHTALQGFGTVAKDDGPWQMKNTKERIAVLEAMLTRIPEEGLSEEEYTKHVEDFYTGLRQSWERLVEERLLCNVTARFQPEVMTQSLRDVSVTDEDHLMVYFNMKKASEYSGHDRAKAREGAIRNRQDMREDLAILRTYERELMKRAEETRSRRRKLEKPPQGDTLPTSN